MSKNKDIISLREWVKFRLHLKGYTLRSFGALHGVTIGTICKVFYRAYPRMERIIASALETQPQELWPDRYDSTGRPNRRNTWYDRKRGEWKPKGQNIIDEVKVK